MGGLWDAIKVLFSIYHQFKGEGLHKRKVTADAHPRYYHTHTHHICVKMCCMHTYTLDTHEQSISVVSNKWKMRAFKPHVMLFIGQF